MTYIKDENQHIIEYFTLFIKNRKIIFISFFITTIFTVIYSLLMPKTYTAQAIIIPSKISDNSLLNMSPSLLGGGLSNLFAARTEESSRFIAILKSRRIAELTINKFNLIDRYGSENIEEALKTYWKKLYITLEDEGTIQVQFQTRTNYFHLVNDENLTRNLCASIVNFMVQNLEEIDIKLQTKQAKAYRSFIEKRYFESESQLNEFDKKLKRFGEKYGIVSLNDQVEASISAAAELESKVLINEAELEILENTVDSNHPRIRNLQIEISVLGNKLKEMKYGKYGAEDLSSVFPLFSKIPELGVQYIQLKREQEIQAYIFQYLTQQYEQAKLEEAKDTPSIQILDSASEPILKTWPKRSLLVIIAAILGVFIGILIILLNEYLNKIAVKNPDKYNAFINQIRYIRKDFFGRKRINNT